MSNAADWMTHDPLTAEASTDLAEALGRMVRHRIDYLPIVNNHRFVGMLSGPDLLNRLPPDPGTEKRVAGDYCQSVEPIQVDDSIEQALEQLKRSPNLPVLDNERLVGTLSHRELLGYLQRRLSPERVRRGGKAPAPERMDSLVNLMRTVSKAVDLQGILGAVLNHLQGAMPIDQAFILLHQPGSEGLSLEAAYYGPGRTVPAPNHMPLQDTLSGYVFLHRKSLRIDDLREERRFPHSQELLSADRNADAPLRSVLATPLSDLTNSFGVVHFWASRPFAYVDSDLELLELVAGYVSSFVQRSWQLDKERQLVLQLQRANRIKDELLAVVTHDLRNSLQGILSASQVLARRSTDELVTRMATGIRQSAQHMATLTNDLHDLGRLGMQAIRLQLKQCNINEVVQAVVEELREFAQTEQVELRELPPCGELLLQADPVRLRQIITNLISNAIKYNRPGGWVEPRTRLEGEWVCLEVEDSGIGIELHEQEAIFELFQRARNHQRLDGSGLGLSITRQLVELHKGKLELTSAPDVGSLFRVLLPR
jgi:signal transduction histidine kinase